VAFIGALGPCILSLLTPFATRAGGVGALIAIRTLMGGFHGCVYGPLFSLYTKWFPLRERTNANAGLLMGSALGSTVMYALAGWLCETETGWPLVFYANALLYIPWMLLWVYFCTNEPRGNRLLTDKELDYIESHVPPVIAVCNIQCILYII